MLSPAEQSDHQAVEGRSWFDKLTTNGFRTRYFKNHTNHDRTVWTIMLA